MTKQPFRDRLARALLDFIHNYLASPEARRAVDLSYDHMKARSESYDSLRRDYDRLRRDYDRVTLEWEELGRGRGWVSKFDIRMARQAAVTALHDFQTGRRS